MTQASKSGRRGAIVVLVTLSLMMLLGVMGLVVDIGWAYFNRRATQAGADAAAQAGARKAFDIMQAAADHAAPASDDANVLDVATKYATANGFTNGGNGGRQTVQIKAANAASDGNYPGLEQLRLVYWVRARVTQRVSSLFIPAAKGGSSLEPGAVAVAAVLLSPVEGSVYLLGGNSDPTGATPGTWTNYGLGTGVDYANHGNGSIVVPGGMFVNSSANGDARTGGNFATDTKGHVGINASYLQFAQDGSNQGKPDNGLSFSNGPQTGDPTMSVNFGSQPPVKTVAQLVPQTGNVVHGVNGGTLSNVTITPGVYVSGVYHTTGGGKKGGGTPVFDFTDQPINLNNVTFDSGGQANATYIFLGGIQGSATFDQGIYVLAGAPNGTALSLDSASDGGGKTYGEMFLNTNGAYRPNAGAPIMLDPAASFVVQAIDSNGAVHGVPITKPFNGPANYPYGGADFKNSNVDLTGMKGRAACTPPCNGPGEDPLSLYQPTVYWQDRNNGSTFILEHGNASVAMRGMMYLPKALLDNESGTAGLFGVTTLIAGAASTGGNSNITLNNPASSAFQTIISLVR